MVRLVVLLWVVGCGGDDDPGSDAAVVDTGGTDAARPDARIGVDAPAPDARGTDARVVPPEACDGDDDDGDGTVDEGADCVRSFGDGSDGDLSVNAPFDLSTGLRADDGAGPFAPRHRVMAVAGRALTVTPTPALEAGDEVLLMHLASSPDGDPSTAGTWATSFVASVSGDDVTLVADPPAPFGIADPTAEVLVLLRVPQFGTVTVESGGVLQATPYGDDGGGVLFFRADTVQVAEGGRIDVSAAGFRGGGPSANGMHGTSGESYPAPRGVVRGGPPSGGGGGGGMSNCDTYNCTTQRIGAGGGGGSYGTAGEDGLDNGTLHRGGVAGEVHGGAELDRLFLGSGGGGGAGGVNGSASNTPGGNGGGIVFVAARSLRVQGVAATDGQLGSLNGTCMPLFFRGSSGGGGSGSGGTLWLVSRDLSLEPDSLSAIGGPTRCQGGGAGGAGRIRLDYATLNGAAYGSTAASGAETASADPDPGFTDTF